MLNHSSFLVKILPHLAVDADLDAGRRAVTGGARRPDAAEHADGAAQVLHLVVQPRVVQHRRPVLRRDVLQRLQLRKAGALILMQ